MHSAFVAAYLSEKKITLCPHCVHIAHSVRPCLPNTDAIHFCHSHSFKSRRKKPPNQQNEIRVAVEWLGKKGSIPLEN